MNYFECQLNKPALDYKCGEEMVFTVYAKSNCEKTECKYVWWVLEGDDGKHSKGLAEITPKKPLVLKTSCDRAGFVHLTCKSRNADATVDLSFDALEVSAGAEIEKLEYLDTLPEDFDKYWGEIENMIADFTPQLLEKKEVTEGVADGFVCYDLKIKTPIDTVASGLLTMPKTDEKLPLIISFMGYGVSSAVICCRDDAIVLSINAHGTENCIPRIEIENNHKDIIFYGFDEEQNKSPYTAYWRNMMIRDLTAAKFAKTLPQWNKKDFIANGGSQGALQATTVAAHEKGITFLNIEIPWFCNLSAENHGYLSGWRPKFCEGLRYFDTAAQATRVTCPVKIIAYLGDYTCPPQTVMTLYNTFDTEKTIEFVQAGTHTYRPPIKVSYRLSNGEAPVVGKTYRHYKGNEYEVLSIADSSENGEQSVVYKALYGDGKVWVRPLSMWCEPIITKDGIKKRFEFVR